MKALIILLKGEKLRHRSLRQIAILCFIELILLKVLQMVVMHRGLLAWELVRKVLSVRIELPNHVVDFGDVVLQSVLLVLNLLVPDLSEMALDVRLGLIGVSKHL